MTECKIELAHEKREKEREEHHEKPNFDDSSELDKSLDRRLEVAIACTYTLIGVMLIFFT